MQLACEQRLLDTSTIPASACRLQYADVLLPSTLKNASFVQKSCEQRFLDTFTIPASACCLQYAGVFLPSTLKDGRLVQVACEQRLFDTSTIPASACCLQYADVLLPNTFKDDRLAQDACKQRLLRTSTIPSSACSLQYAGCRPSTLKLARFSHGWKRQRGIFAKGFDDQTPHAATGKASRPSSTSADECAPANQATGNSDGVQGLTKAYHPQCACCVSRYITVQTKAAITRKTQRLEEEKIWEHFGNASGPFWRKI